MPFPDVIGHTYFKISISTFVFFQFDFEFSQKVDFSFFYWL